MVADSTLVRPRHSMPLLLWLRVWLGYGFMKSSLPSQQSNFNHLFRDRLSYMSISITVWDHWASLKVKKVFLNNIFMCSYRSQSCLSWRPRRSQSGYQGPISGAGMGPREYWMFRRRQDKGNSTSLHTPLWQEHSWYLGHRIWTKCWCNHDSNSLLEFSNWKVG